MWRLPEADDALDDRHRATTTTSSSTARSSRPAAPGEQVSPNLAGRASAAFALGAQSALARGDRAAARRWLAEAASLYAQAKTTDVGELVTAFPHAYYPEDSWKDDMEFGAAELAIAGQALGDPRAAAGCATPRTGRSAYLASDSQDTLNLYDTSALAHTDLVRRSAATRSRRPRLTSRRPEAPARRRVSRRPPSSPFGHAVDVTNFDAATRSFGFAATAHLYRSVTGRPVLRRVRDPPAQLRARRQRVGGLPDGRRRHDVPALPAAPGGQPRPGRSRAAGVITGAVVNGPNGADNFEDIGIPDGATAARPRGNRSPPSTPTRPLPRRRRAWPSSEPAIDFVGTGALAFALTARN